MARYLLDHIKQKYGWSGENYRGLMTKIIAHNSEAVARKMTKVNTDLLEAENRRIKSAQKRVVLPDVTDVLPKRSVFIRKGADRGKIMTDNLRDKLTADLREVLKQPDFIRRRGALAGTLKQEAIDSFRERIEQTFENYTKKDPAFGGVPKNIKVIATTEVRSVVDQMKNEYMTQLQKKNPDAKIKKRWKHNGSRHRGYSPRGHHAAADGMEVLNSESFILRDQKGQKVVIPYPHAPGLPPEEVINCSCECIYMISKGGRGDGQGDAD